MFSSNNSNEAESSTQHHSSVPHMMAAVSATDTLEARRAQQAQRRHQLVNRTSRRQSSSSSTAGATSSVGSAAALRGIRSTTNHLSVGGHQLGSPATPPIAQQNTFGASPTTFATMMGAGGGGGGGQQQSHSRSGSNMVEMLTGGGGGGPSNDSGDSSAAAGTSATMQCQLKAYGISPTNTDATRGEGGSPHYQPEGEEELKDLKTANETLYAATSDPKALAYLCPPTGPLYTQVERVKKGSHDGGRQYQMYLNDEGHRFVLAARKRQKKQTANYLISVDADDLDRESSSIVSKVRGDFGGTEFVCYDDGVRAEDADTELEARKELCAVLFDANVAGTKGSRKMTVILPKRIHASQKEKLANQRGTQLEVWRPATEAQTLISEYKRNPNSDRLVVLENKAPTWNEQLRSYQLNFKGRVTKASVKNFQLCLRSEQQGGSSDASESPATPEIGSPRSPSKSSKKPQPPTVLQFGKRHNDEFALDFQYPLDAVQALGIAMSVFDNKLLCD